MTSSPMPFGPGAAGLPFPEAPWAPPPAFPGEVPVGVVVPYAGKLDSAAGAFLQAQGWLPCDGRSVEVLHYPQLYAALGTLYGGQGGSFNLPDYRGYFLRGVDGGTGKDPEAADRTPPAGSQEAQDVGSTQPCALQDHTHEYETVPSVSGSSTGQAAGAVSDKTEPTTGASVQGQPLAVSPRETRPLNIYVHYLIKAAVRHVPPLPGAHRLHGFTPEA